MNEYYLHGFSTENGHFPLELFLVGTKRYLSLDKKLQEGLSKECRDMAIMVACYHMFKVCASDTQSVLDRIAPGSSSNPPPSASVLSICRDDCRLLET